MKTGQDHVHAPTGPKESPWLPYEVRGERKGLRPHPCCRSCGLVKNIGPDKARRLGFYANTLAWLRGKLRNGRLNDVTIRLIMQKLPTYDGFEDTYGMTAYAQERIFARAVADIAGVDEAIVLAAM